MPFGRYGHCVVKLRTGQVMILGGVIGREQNETLTSVIIFDPKTQTFDRSLPHLNYERTGLGCVVFNSAMHEKREVVLAVGGYGQATAEVYDYSQPDATWTKSNY